MPTHSQQLKSFILQEYGIEPIIFRKIKKGVANENYFVKSNNLSCVCKLYPSRTVPQIQFELKVLEKLSKNKFSSPRLIKTRKRKPYTLFHNMPCVLLQYIAGRELCHPSASELADIGYKLGQLHKILRSTRSTVKRVAWDLGDIKKLASKKRRQIPKKRFSNAKSTLSFLVGELDLIYIPDTLPKGITHQDVKPENIIRDFSGGLHIIDFDNSYYGTLLYDILTPAIWM